MFKSKQLKSSFVKEGLVLFLEQSLHSVTLQENAYKHFFFLCRILPLDELSTFCVSVFVCGYP